MNKLGKVFQLEFWSFICECHKIKYQQRSEGVHRKLSDWISRTQKAIFNYFHAKSNFHKWMICDFLNNIYAWGEVKWYRKLVRTISVDGGVELPSCAVNFTLPEWWMLLLKNKNINHSIVAVASGEKGRKYSKYFFERWSTWANWEDQFVSCEWVEELFQYFYSYSFYFFFKFFF
jgi:hypothetical protein